MTAATEPNNVIDEAFTTIKQWQTNSDRLDQEHRDNAHKVYLKILLRRDNPEDGDAQVLAEVVRDFGITADQIEADLRLIKRYRKFRPYADRKVQLIAAEREARAKLNETEQRHKVELEEAQREFHIASRERAIATHETASELLKLAELRPEFFDRSGRIPTLLYCPIDDSEISDA